MHPSKPNANAQAAEQLDAHVREIIDWHFNPETGCPFWLDWAKEPAFDPRKEVHTFADLKNLRHFEDDWLRGGPVRRWLPKGLAGKPIYVFETGGSTGVPKSRLQIDDFRIDYENFSNTLSDETFPKGADWLMLGPSGPRRLRLAIEHLAQYPRRNRLLRRSRSALGHQVHQARRNPGSQSLQATLHRSGPDHPPQPRQHPVHVHHAQAAGSPGEKIDLAHYGIKGIFCGGTELTPQFHRFAREELCPGIDFVPTYGNTLMGLATHKPFDPADNYEIIYHAPQPRAVVEIVELRQRREESRLRPARPRHADDADEGNLHPPLPRARPGDPPPAVRAVSVGRRGERAAV